MRISNYGYDGGQKMLQKKSGNGKELGARLFTWTRECTERCKSVHQKRQPAQPSVDDFSIEAWVQSDGHTPNKGPNSAKITMNFLDNPYPQPPWARDIFWIKGKRRSQFHLQTRNDSDATFQYWSIIGTTFIIMIPDLKRELSAIISRLLWVGDYFPRFVWHFGKMTSSV